MDNMIKVRLELHKLFHELFATPKAYSSYIVGLHMLAKGDGLVRAGHTPWFDEYHSREGRSADISVTLHNARRTPPPIKPCSYG